MGRFISLERIIEDSKETYYETLLKSSQHWHEDKHDLRPWWNYFLGTLIAAYKEFEDRVGVITSARGAKRDMIRQTIERLPSRFRFSELHRACAGVSYPTLKRTLFDLKREKHNRGTQYLILGNRYCVPLLIRRSGKAGRRDFLAWFFAGVVQW